MKINNGLKPNQNFCPCQLKLTAKDTGSANPIILCRHIYVTDMGNPPSSGL
jgi:hypothetical protein